MFNTAHFQLLLHYQFTNETSNVTQQGLRILSTPREISLLRPETNRAGNDAYRYQLNFKFNNLTDDDFASYSIMAGNTFGYDVYQFRLVNGTKQGKSWLAITLKQTDLKKIISVNTARFWILNTSPAKKSSLTSLWLFNKKIETYLSPIISSYFSFSMRIFLPFLVWRN